MFLGQNAVVDAMAKAYNTSKEQVLDSESRESVAVRLALGETQLVQDTKQFLEQNGVSLDAFNQVTALILNCSFILNYLFFKQAPKLRSKCVILAKNLPAGTSAEELRDIFGKHGELGRVLLPPSGVTAIIEFGDPSEAKTAFTKLAYTKFKHLPLYLEWAPEDTFTTKAVIAKKTKKKESQDDPANGNFKSQQLALYLQ